MKLSELYPAKNLWKPMEATALVVSRTEMLPRIKTGTWECVCCGCTQDKKVEGLKRAQPPMQCLKDDAGGCNRAAHATKFTLIDSHDVDEQWLELVEPPEEVIGSRPKTLRARLEGEENMDIIEPGDLVWLGGILKRYDEPAKDGSVKVAPEVYLDCMEHKILNKVDLDMTVEEVGDIKKFSKMTDPLYDAIVPSIAEGVVCADDAKAALACILFGGVDAEGAGLRGRIHLFMVGDPGTAKTKLMKSCHNIMPKSQYTTIPGSTEVGLTAALVRDPDSNKYHLEAGVLPMAHGSVAFIDECGQATPQQWKSIEECQESGWTTRSGGGEHGRLRAKTTVVCAANPKDGSRWDDTKKIQDQIKIPDSTLDRFDLVFLIPDDPKNDEEIREHIDKHHGYGDAPDAPPMDEELLSKYIAYAQRIKPRPSEEAVKVFHEAHKVIRAIEDANFGIRAYEGYYRLGEAIARMSLSRTITKEHAEQAKRIHHAGWELLIKQQVDAPASSQKDKHQAMLNWLRQNAGEGKGIKFNLIIRDHKDWPDGEVRKVLERLEKDKEVFQPSYDVWGVV